jgi:hypothetical protein
VASELREAWREHTQVQHLEKAHRVLQGSLKDYLQKGAAEKLASLLSNHPHYRTATTDSAKAATERDNEKSAGSARAELHYHPSNLQPDPRNGRKINSGSSRSSRSSSPHGAMRHLLAVQVPFDTAKYKPSSSPHTSLSRRGRGQAMHFGPTPSPFLSFPPSTRGGLASWTGGQQDY